MFTCLSTTNQTCHLQMWQHHLPFRWTYKPTPHTAQSWPTSLTSAPYAKGWWTASTGTSRLEMTEDKCVNLNTHSTCSYLFTDDCPLWCGRFVILNTTPKHSMSPDHSLSLPPSLSPTSCCNSLSEYVVIKSQGCVLFYRKILTAVTSSVLYCPSDKESFLLPPPFFFFRDQSLTDLMPLYKTMKKATFSDSEDEVCLFIDISF